MLHLIRLLAWGHLRGAPGRTAMTLLGCALGVGMMFAIDVVSASLSASFRGSVDALAGRAAWVVGENTGVDEDLLEPIRAVDGVESARPLIRESVRAHEARLTVLALDTLNDDRIRGDAHDAAPQAAPDPLLFLNDPHGVLVAGALAKRLNLSVGQALPCHTSIGQVQLNVHGILPDNAWARALGGDLLVMDVYAAQALFARGARFDRIDVVPARDDDERALGARLRSAVKERAQVSRPKERSEEAERLISGFRVGIWLASLIAMVGSAFIIYNVMAVAVVQRRRELGVLRALGATRAQVLALVVGEGALVGLLGAALGLVLGAQFGRAVLDLAHTAVAELAGNVAHGDVQISLLQLVTGLSVGIGTALIATALPALRASAVEPAAALASPAGSSDAGVPPRHATRAFVVACIVASAAAACAHMLESFPLGASAAALVSLAGAFSAPAAVRVVARVAGALGQRARPSVRLGIDAFRDNQARNAVAVAALGLALGSVVNIGYFLGSIKHGTLTWFERTLRADVLVMGGESVQATFAHPFPEALAERVRALPDVAFVNALRVVRQDHDHRPFHLAAHDLSGTARFDEVPVVAGDLPEALSAIDAGSAVAVSETFARTFSVRLHDTLRLQTPRGLQSFRVALVYVDYGSNLGIVAMSRVHYLRIWQDHRLDALWVYARPGTDTEALRAQVIRAIGPEHALLVLANAAFKEGVMGIFDRSFMVTHALEVVAIVVALLGVANALAVSVLDRARELGILRAIGATRAQVNAVFLVEALLVGLSAAGLGLLSGAASSLYMVKELLRFELGWRLAWHGSPWTTLEVVLAAQLVAALACLWPIRAASKTEVAAALSYP